MVMMFCAPPCAARGMVLYLQNNAPTKTVTWVCNSRWLRRERSFPLLFRFSLRSFATVRALLGHLAPWLQFWWKIGEWKRWLDFVIRQIA